MEVLILMDSMDSLEKQIKDIQTAMATEMESGRPGISRRTINERVENILNTLRVAEAAAGKLWSDESKLIYKWDELCRQAKAFFDTTAEQVNRGLEDIKAEAASLKGYLEKEALPQRPKPTYSYDAVTQEAELAGRKNDLRMLLDRIDRNETPARMAELLEKAVKSGDALGAWLLAGSDWPGMYLESRGLDLGEYQGRVAAVLDRYDLPSVTKARKQLAFVNSTRGVYGLLALTQTVAGVKLDRLSVVLKVGGSR